MFQTPHLASLQRCRRRLASVICSVNKCCPREAHKLPCQVQSWMRAKLRRWHAGESSLRLPGCQADDHELGELSTRGVVHPPPNVRAQARRGVGGPRSWWWPSRHSSWRWWCGSPSPSRSAASRRPPCRCAGDTACRSAASRTEWHHQVHGNSVLHTSRLIPARAVNHSSHTCNQLILRRCTCNQPTSCCGGQYLDLPWWQRLPTLPHVCHTRDLWRFSDRPL